MNLILTIVHIIVALFLVVIVLLQHGKGADMGATFGGASQTVFGTEGPLPLLNKVTTWAAIIFMLTSLALAFLSSHPGSRSVMREVAPPPVPAGNTLEKAPATVPMPETAPAHQTEAVPQQFPGAKQAPAEGEQNAPASPAAEAPAQSAPAAEKAPAPAETTEKQGENKQ